MKNKLNYIIYLFSLLIVFTSCEDEDAIRVPEVADGATMRIQVPADKSFFNAADITNAAIEYSLFTVNDNIQSVELYLDFFDLSEDSTYTRQLFKTYTMADFDSEGAIRNVQVTSQELAQFLGFNSAADLSGGDRVDIVNFTTLTDGRVFPDSVLTGTDFATINLTPNIVNSASTTSFSVGFTAYVACPTEPSDWEGDYTAMVQNVNAFCGLLDCSASREASIVYIGDPEPFRYSVTNHDGGLWCSFDPASCDRQGAFYDICGNPLLLPSPTGYGDHQEAGAGSTRDPNTGVITFTWCNFFNPVCGETVLVPQP